MVDPDLNCAFYYCHLCGGFRAVRAHSEAARLCFFRDHPCVDVAPLIHDSDEEIDAWAREVLTAEPGA